MGNETAANVSIITEKSCKQCEILLLVFAPTVAVQLFLNILVWLYCQRKRIKAYRTRKKPIVVRRLSSADRWRNGTIQNSAERDLYEEENDEENKRGRNSTVPFYVNPHVYQTNRTKDVIYASDPLHDRINPSIGGHSSTSPYDYLQLANSAASTTGSFLGSRTSTFSSNELLDEDSPIPRSRYHDAVQLKVPVRNTKSLINESLVRTKGLVGYGRNRTSTSPAHIASSRQQQAFVRNKYRSYADEGIYNYPRAKRFKNYGKPISTGEDITDIPITEEYLFEHDDSIYIHPKSLNTDGWCTDSDEDEKTSDIYIKMELNDETTNIPHQQVVVPSKATLYAVVNKESKAKREKKINTNVLEKIRQRRESKDGLNQNKDLSNATWYSLPKEPFYIMKNEIGYNPRVHKTMFSRKTELKNRPKVAESDFKREGSSDSNLKRASDIRLDDNSNYKEPLPNSRRPNDEINHFDKQSLYEADNNNSEKNSDYETIPYDPIAEEQFKREQKLKSLLMDLDDIINYDKGSMC